MSTQVAGPEIERLIQLLASLPGLGPRSSSCAALHLIRKRAQLLDPLAEAMRIAHDRIATCSVCGNVDTRDPCTICADERRDPSMLVVVESVGDLWALERADATRGRYHVLGGALSPVDGQTTAHYITDLLGPYAVEVTRLAHGVPVGGELDYLDDGTLAAAMRQRTAF